MPNSKNQYGIAAAFLAFTIWGLLPLYWGNIHGLSPISIASYRTLSCLAVLMLINLLRKSFLRTASYLKDAALVRRHFFSGLLLAANWLFYIWANLNGHVIDAALGYFLNPFFNMLFGWVWFQEKYNAQQKTAIVIAILGAAMQFLDLKHMPWLAFTLAISFALYAVVNKKSPLDPISALSLETLFVAPIAIALLCYFPIVTSGLHDPASNKNIILLLCSGLVTVAPLFLFGYAARKISLSTLGMIQFMNPTCQFLIGKFVFHEPFSFVKMLSFPLIWLAILIYTHSLTRVKNAE